MNYKSGCLAIAVILVGWIAYVLVGTMMIGFLYNGLRETYTTLPQILPLDMLRIVVIFNLLFGMTLPRNSFRTGNDK